MRPLRNVCGLRWPERFARFSEPFARSPAIVARSRWPMKPTPRWRSRRWPSSRRRPARRWPVIELALVHRVGDLDLGEVSVVVAVSCPHRQDSFEACRWLIDTLKEVVPIWKKEIWADGNEEWIHPGPRPSLRPDRRELRYAAADCSGIMKSRRRSGLQTVVFVKSLMPPDRLIDSFGRLHNNLRISVTDRCNIRCVYCMPEQVEFLPRAALLSFEEIERFVRIAVTLGINKVRLTGGEPLVRRDIPGWWRNWPRFRA